jgi:hypothetical protein
MIHRTHEQIATSVTNKKKKLTLFLFKFFDKLLSSYLNCGTLLKIMVPYLKQGVDLSRHKANDI